jgi:predicted porin
LRAGGTAVDIDTWFVSASAPLGKFVVKATYGQTEDDQAAGDAKAKKFGIGGDYLLSKRTKLYATYGTISNGNAAAYQISPGANCTTGAGALVACASALGTKGFDIGLAHTF